MWLSILMCYPWAYSITLTQLYPPYLAQILGFWVTYAVEMMSLCHGWGWQPPQTASWIHIRHIQSVWEHWYDVHRHIEVALHNYLPYLTQILGFLVTCGVQMMSLRHGWGWQSTQTTSHIHIKYSQSTWEYWYGVHRYIVAALHSCPPYLAKVFGVLGHLWSPNVVILSWLRLTASSNCFPHPY